MAPDGLCKKFDASGNGYSRGEGIAALLLKPVDQAVRNGDYISAAIRGTGINQDGKTIGITVTSADAQAQLIRTTYTSEGVDIEDTHYFEAHGTGTQASDPVKLEAISRTTSEGRSPRNKLIVGSVKSNIRHLESVADLAGLAGLIKSVYILETGLISANIHFTSPNPAITFEKWDIKQPKAKLFALSASDQTGLKHLKDTLSLSVTIARDIHRRRILLQLQSKTLLVLESKTMSSASARAISDNPRIGFVFTGRGAQWARIAHELSQYEVFHNSIEAADEDPRAVQGCKWSVVEELAKDEKSSRIDLPEFSQALYTVLQVAAVDLLST